MKKYIAPLAIVVLVACSGDKPTPEQIATHQQEVEQWYEKRLAELKGPEGWLNLAGLFWLKDGINTFGAGSQNEIVYPAGKISERAGYFMVKDQVVTLVPDSKTEITAYGKVLTGETIIFHPDSTDAKTRHRGAVVKHGSLEWFIIRRDDKLGVRLRDFESDGLQKFKGIERYNVDIAWKVKAKFQPAPPGKTIDITNVLGQVTPTSTLGSYVFTYEGKEYKLDATGTDPAKQQFIVFADSTTGHETYPAGRFLYVDYPKENSDGFVYIDFNQSYNPPCAFTEFATCPLPTKENTLPFAVRAGEKNYDLTAH